MSTTNAARHKGDFFHHASHPDAGPSAPDKLTVKQIGILFLSVAAFGIAIAAYAGSERDNAIGRTGAEPASVAEEQAGSLLLRP